MKPEQQESLVNRTEMEKEKTNQAERKKSVGISRGLQRAIGVLLSAGLLLGIGLAVRNELRQMQNTGLFDIYLRREDIHAIALDGERIWAGGAGGLFVLTPKKETTSDKATEKTPSYQSEKIGRYRFVRAIWAENGRVWVGHDEGLTLIDGETERHYTEKDGLSDRRVNALYKDSKGTLWIGTWGGLVLMEGTRIRNTFTAEDGLADDMVNVLYEDLSGAIWCGSYVAPRGGISVFKNHQWICFTTKEGLLHSNINAIIGLNNGNILVGGGLFTKGGATIFSPAGDGWEISDYIHENDGIAGAKVRSLLQDSRLRLWVGSEYDGLAVFDSFDELVAPIIIDSRKGLSHDEVKVIAEDANQTVWIGTMRGLVRIEKGGIENVR
jgi:ligand-binding sensor domain-containing protein